MVSPSSGLLLGKEPSKGLPCAFQLRSRTSHPRVEVKMCNVYASKNHLKTHSLQRWGFHRKLKLVTEGLMWGSGSCPLWLAVALEFDEVGEWGASLKCTDQLSLRLERLVVLMLQDRSLPGRACAPLLRACMDHGGS